MTVDHEAFAEANMPPPARVVETPEAEEAPEADPSPDFFDVADPPDLHPPDYGCDLRRLLPVVPLTDDFIVAMVQGAARSIAGEGATLVSVSRRREGDVLHVTTTWLAKGRFDQITAHVDGGSVAFVRRLK